VVDGWTTKHNREGGGGKWGKMKTEKKNGMYKMAVGRLGVEKKKSGGKENKYEKIRAGREVPSKKFQGKDLGLKIEGELRKGG